MADDHRPRLRQRAMRHGIEQDRRRPHGRDDPCRTGLAEQVAGCVEVDVGNGHFWRRRKSDGTWCRFSPLPPSLCGTEIGGLGAKAQPESLPREVGQNDIAAMRSDVHDVMQLLTKLMGELQQMKEQLPIEHDSDFEEDDLPTWEM